MNIVIIQARMGSTRLPGKVLKPLGSRTLLEQVITRSSTSKLADKIIVATSHLKKDNSIAELCLRNNIECCRGSEEDVLARYYEAALPFRTHKPTIIRITADCPLNSGEVIDFGIRLFDEHRLDFFSNSFAPKYEDGSDIEIFNCEVLEDTYRNSVLASEREHVTFFMRNSGRYLCGYQKFIPEYFYKLSVDSQEDFDLVSGIFDYFSPDENFSIHQVVQLLKEKPELLQRNKNSVINSGQTK